MAAAAAIEVRGLREFRAELRRIDRSGGGSAWSRELGATHRRLSTMVAGMAARKATSGQQKHFRDLLRPRGTVAGARIAWAPKANTAFMGAKKKTGWYAALRYRDSTRQHPEWVGNQWTAGGPGGPYAVNPAIRDNITLILNTYAHAVDRVARRAFPS